MWSEADQLSFQTKDWAAIPRIARTVPFGYRIDDDDPDLLQPVPLELEALKLAKRYVKRFSYRDVAEWLTATTGRYISHVGLKKRLENETNRRREAVTLKVWASLIEQKRAKAEKIINKRVGARATTEGN
jgi:hypothetical protein